MLMRLPDTGSGQSKDYVHLETRQGKYFGFYSSFKPSLFIFYYSTGWGLTCALGAVLPFERMLPRGAESTPSGIV